MKIKTRAKRERKKKRKQVVERGVKERELKRTVAHENDLGHVPFREV